MLSLPPDYLRVLESVGIREADKIVRRAQTDEALKQRLRVVTQREIDRGVFALPTFFVRMNEGTETREIMIHGVDQMKNLIVRLRIHRGRVCVCMCVVSCCGLCVGVCRSCMLVCVSGCVAGKELQIALGGRVTSPVYAAHSTYVVYTAPFTNSPSP